MIMHVADRDIAGVTVEIHVNGQVGTFEIHRPGDDTARLGYGDTLEKALAQARVNLAKEKVKISVSFVSKAGEKGVATGRHASNNDILVRLDGKSDRLNGYQGRQVFRPDIPDEQLAEYQDELSAKRDAEQALRRIEGAWGMDIGTAVDRALAAAAESVATKGGEE